MTNPNNWPDPAKPGVPLNPERDGWHWLHHPEDLRAFPCVWDASIAAWCSGEAHSPRGIVELRYQYLGPCLTPAEVAAREQAASSVACRMNAGELVKVMRLERRVQRQRRALSRLYARRHEWKARERAARREGMEEAAKEVDCGCDIREAVLARLESQGEKRASYLCTHVCSALQAAAIRAAAKENP